MNKFFSFFIVVFLLPVSHAVAQQLPVYNHYLINPAIYNAAEMIAPNYMQAMLISRKQWIGIDGAPQTNMLNVFGPINEDKVGLGLSLSHTNINIINRTSGYGHYAYQFNLKKNHKVALSLSLGYIQNSINFSKIMAEDRTEPILFNGPKSSSNFDATAGALYSYHGLKTGIAAHYLNNTTFQYQSSINSQNMHYSLIRHFVGYVSYKHNFLVNYFVEPVVFVKDVQGMPLLLDVSTRVLYRDMLWLAATWQQSMGVSFMMGGMLNNRIKISYAYTMSTGDMAAYNKGSHEIALGFKIFTNSGKGKLIRLSKDEIDRQTQIEKEQYQEIDRLQEKDKEIEKEVDNTQKDVEDQQREMEQLKKIFDENGARVEDIIKKYNYNIKNIDTVEIDTTINIDDSETEFYIVLGTFFKISDAKLFQRVLRREIDLKTRLTYNEEDQTYFVFFKKYNNRLGVDARIKREIKRLEQMGIGKLLDQPIWLYHKND